MSRPKSMPDFSALMDASTPLFEARAQNRRQTSPVRGQGYPRKKLSISLAAGLIMNNDTPKSTGRPTSSGRVASPERLSLHSTKEEELVGVEGNDSLFYAYALKSSYTNSPPYILTFASATICTRWWALVQREYPDSERPGPQLFVLTGDCLESIRDNLRFYSLRNKWFYTGEDNLSNTTSIIPLQNADGHAIAPGAPAVQSSSDKLASFSFESLAESVCRLASIVEGNTEQINALSVAQSAGLQRMQEINEATTTQIKALADSQTKLQALVDQNASHYVALSNTSFQTQEQMKSIMKSTTTQIQGLSKSQAQLANTCDSMMRGIESLANSVEQIGVGSTISDAGSATSISPFGALSNRISPPPRKLNRKIKGVWYEYDGAITPNASPRRNVTFVDTPPKSSIMTKKG